MENYLKVGIKARLSDGKEIFKQLANTSDVIIESFRPGYLDELGLGYSALSQLNPKIICYLFEDVMF